MYITNAKCTMHEELSPLHVFTDQHIVAFFAYPAHLALFFKVHGTLVY